MDETKLQKIKMELEKARTKRDVWDRKVKDLEQKYQEAENTCIHEIVHAANLSLEQLAELIRKAPKGVPDGDPENVVHQKEDE